MRILCRVMREFCQITQYWLLEINFERTISTFAYVCLHIDIYHQVQYVIYYMQCSDLYFYSLAACLCGIHFRWGLTFKSTCIIFAPVHFRMENNIEFNRVVIFCLRADGSIMRIVSAGPPRNFQKKITTWKFDSSAQSCAVNPFNVCALTAPEIV